MNIKFLGLMAAAVFSYAACAESASAGITYDLTLGPSAVGTITTDGSTGVLQTGNILDFNITVSTAGGSSTILGPLSGANFFQYGTDNQNNSLAFTATLTSLFFDFSAVGGTPYLLFQSGTALLCFNGAAGNCSGNPSALATFVTGDPGYTLQAESGNVEIAAVAVAGAVPEPSTWAMMILGFAGVGFMAYRRKSKQAFMAA